MQTAVILICTYNRPTYLSELLAALSEEVSTAPCKILSVVVVDNGTQSVKDLVAAFKSALSLDYIGSPNLGLVGARNCSLRHGLRHKPDYLVFIDDDEVPECGWLKGLLAAMSTSGADFAVGPVKPKFSQVPPAWAPDFFTKSGEAFCTSNLIMRASAVPHDEAEWFQDEFTFTGGEDGEFLGRMAACGATFVTAHTAVVWEHIPSDRVTARYLWRRGFRDGVVAAKSGRGDIRTRVINNIILGLTKFGYGFNHFFWSLGDFGRFYRAIDDLSMGCGLIFGSAGGSIRFYVV